jgi:SPP1 family predicted phage head-tail adaptor
MSRNGWPSIDPGDLRHPITIQTLQSPNPPTFDVGGPVQNWVDFTTAWADITPMKGTDVPKGGQTGTKTPVAVKIRFQPGITPNMRVKAADYGEPGAQYDYFIIESIEDVDKRGVLLVLTCLGLGDNL